MKRSAEIIAYLSKPDTARSVLLAPNAPPVTRTATGVEVVLNVVLDGGDIYDTLKALHIQAGGREDEPLRDSGAFSFAVPAIGRFRVHYATQRGTKVARIAVIPFNIPSLAECCADAADAQRLSTLIRSSRTGIIAVHGPHSAANNTLVYALLRDLNESQRLVIYAVERTLTYLIAHGESIVIQTELGADVASLEQGIVNALVFDPSVLFVGDVRPTDSVPSLTHAVGAGVLTIVSSVSIPGATLLQQYLPAAPADGAATGGPNLRCVVEVAPRDHGRCALRITE